ncbi:AraC family transcriptional regulator [Paenibacillus sp. URB8-2]|uniref:AraC family transcriptional regulator n=1 Tax=Paenibacillus sp. URB8-2 TaxID=2741301 RepID=UPI0015BE9E79|nr:AraC family transcriptional regulator [Paenibacillus sp. URB8-2]BCG58300.1 hypothetical protein PUR_17250 [Paenibacillus sp. URB8-2]
MLVLHSVHFDKEIPHWRTLMEEIRINVLVLVTLGKVKYTVNGQPIIAERGDLLVLPKGVRRAGENDESGLHQKYTILFHCGADVAEAIPFLSLNSPTLFKPRNFETVRRKFEQLFLESREAKSYSSFISLGVLQEVLGMLAREFEQPEVSPMKLKYAQKIQQYLLEHYREQVQIHELASLIRRSPNYTISIYREVTGQSPIRYLHQLRIIEACNLLLNSDMSISSISSYLGYYDTSYFFRIFKKQTSYSPSEFAVNGRLMEQSGGFV